MAITAKTIRATARRGLGLDELRPGQLEGVQAVVNGRDALVIMATGAGKTAIYRIAGLLIPGPTIVVSPLIALQRDQVEAAGDGVDGAVELNSTLGERAREEVFARLEAGETEYVLLAPEQLANEETRERLRAAKPSLMVVDEAHCVSEWGHDFRPDYLELGAAAEALGRPPILALTATAAPPVRDEVIERLGMRDPELVVRGFDRPNIRLGVERFHDAGVKERALLDAAAEAEGAGIVYVATQKGTERVAAALCERGLRAAAYHGGMSGRRRDAAQEAFMSADGDVDVMVATVAFGMGVDKADVRWVFHLDVSPSVDAYFQEMGRAGRDGEPARAQLFYRPEDLGRQRFRAGGDGDRAELERSRLAMMRTYAEHDGCRRAFLLGYFGEPYDPPCGNCDVCEAGGGVPAADADDAGFAAGDRVRHAEFGAGTVQHIHDGQITVVFEDIGYKTLAAEIVASGELLERED